MGLLVDRAPALFREIYAVSRESYRGTRASYQVSARLEQTPAAGRVPDAELSRTDSRQVLHVGYGVVRTPHNEQGTTRLADSLRSLMSSEAPGYALDLEEHVGRHLQAFSETAR